MTRAVELAREVIALPRTEREKELAEEVLRAAKEIFELRESLMHACALALGQWRQRDQIWAMRQAANQLNVPFSHDEVQRRFEELTADDKPDPDVAAARLRAGEKGGERG